jgi:hypothetical protein
MRDKSTGRACDPKFVRRQIPIEAHPMQRLNQRRIVPIEITEKMRSGHTHPRSERQ